MKRLLRLSSATGALHNQTIIASGRFAIGRSITNGVYGDA